MVSGGSIHDDSYVSIAGAQTGDITGWVLAGGIPRGEEGAIIRGNHCLSVGLRIGIEVMAANRTSSIIAGNVVSGLHQGNKVYKGTYSNYSQAATHVREVVVANNHVTYCREIGIYMRSNLGILCDGNYVSHCGLYDTGSGTAYGGIVTRVQADRDEIALPLVAGNKVSNNYIYNCGKTTGTSVPAIGIQVRTENTSVQHNKIVQDMLSSGNGIIVSWSDRIHRALIEGNEIRNFQTGINFAAGTWRRTFRNTVIKGNEIYGCGSGINLDSKSWYNHIRGNGLYDCATGIRLRNCVYNFIEGNTFIRISERGIHIRGGTYLGQAENGTVRQDPSNYVNGNVFEHCAVPHAVDETAPGDTTFAGRCRMWRDDRVEGAVVPALVPSGPSAERPTGQLQAGDAYFDTTLGRRIDVRTAGAAERAELTLTAGCSAAGSVTVTLNGVPHEVAVTTAAATPAAAAALLRDAYYAGWAVGGFGATVTFTAYDVGNKTDAAYSAGLTGVSGSMATVRQGTNHEWVDGSGAAV